MITKDNLPEVLRSFEFEENKNVWTKKYSTGASITVDFNSAKINYAPLDENFSMGEYPTKEKPSSGFVIHRDTTINFNSKENFVCLVCIHLLLKKGYEAKHIVIEPAFKVAHGIKPSFGDILVFDKEYDPLVLIENKTYGAEFSKEWNLMQKDGGQLFGYLGEIVKTMKLCQNLVLFAADFEENRIVPKSHIITLKDNEKRIAELDNPKTFANAQGKYFEVWNQTYRNAKETRGLFEDDIEAYTIGKLKYTINDLNPLSHAEIKPIYNEFAKILRNHAITDFEHSFYILIDLFLCKITDELNNPEDLQFYYKGIARDTPKEYCNRLLKLYQVGKKQLFDVDVINKEEDDIKQIFVDTGRILNGLYTGIKELFEEMKFYNIKKFNFIDVENKEDFEMNFQILIEITSLIQDINLSSSETNHFFGDLFEGLLSKNVHQTEGQFFTPLPIVNFIIKSLPRFPNTNKVKVLDYACGAGHFLTEFVKHYPKAKVYGIEKSQTLSQVAKIATIINGSQNSRVVFKDSLSLMNTMDVRYQGFDRESFDCLIANPPYSVKGFLNTLEQKDREQFELIKSIDEKAYLKNDSIECFFIERARHFLKKDGLMGIILPVSILSNSNERAYLRTREIILANFNILAIALMNSRTFGSTGTNTVILFAQKVAKKNSESLLHAFMEKKDYRHQYISSGAIDSYIQKQGYPIDEYYALMQDNVLGEELKGTDVFKDYDSNFKPTAINKNIQREWFTESEFYKEGLKERTKEYRILFNSFLESDSYKELEVAEHRKQFIAFVKEIEGRKLNIYIQTANNIVAILQSPPEKIGDKSNKNEVIRFLGYDWSNRKGYEGIKYLTNQVVEDESEEEGDDKDKEIVQAINSIKYIETPLYNPDDDNDVTKFSYALRKHIISSCNKFSFGAAKANIEKPFVGENNSLLQIVRLTDLIDFGKTAFNLSIRTIVEKTEAAVVYRYPTKRLEQLLLHIDGPLTKIGKEEIMSEGKFPVITQEAGNLISGYTDNNEPITDLPLIVFGDHSCTFKYTDFKFVRGADGTQLIKINEEEILTRFLYYFLFTIKIENSGKYERHFKYLKNVQIPLPPITLQQKIIAECENVDTEAQDAKVKIAELQENIIEIVADIKGKITKLGTIVQFKNGLNYKKSSQGISISIVGVADFKENKSPEWDKVQNIKINEHVDDSFLLHKNDLVTVRSNGSRELVGRFMLIDKEPEERTTFSGFSIRVRIVSDEVDSEFLYYLLASANVRQSLTTGSNGANIKSLNQDLLSNLEIPLPSLSEQKDIVDKIGTIEAKIASLKRICDGASARKEAVLHRELIEDDKDNIGITTEKNISIPPTDEYQPVDDEPLMAAESFARYKWEGFDQSIREFFGNDQTILVGCYKGKDYREWIDAHRLYNIRMGKTKGSMEANRELFDSTSLLVLYEVGKPDKLSAYKIVGHQKINKEELIEMGYPNKKPRKNYMSFSLEPLDMDLTFLVEHHLIERIIELDADHAKGTPIFIEP
jgi:type I restriction-modification system DNA methylase subunit/restriction endonuclease S subunit